MVKGVSWLRGGPSGDSTDHPDAQKRHHYYTKWIFLRKQDILNESQVFNLTCKGV